MSHRQASTGKKDKKVFTTTAKKIKKVNIAPKIQRGGIRM